MKKEKAKKPHKKPTQLIPLTPDSLNPNDKTKDVVEGQQEAGAASNNNDKITSIPQPLLIKVENAKKKWWQWKRSEIISVAGLLLTFSALLTAINAFNKTSKSVEIAEQNLKDNRTKDSIMNEPYLQIEQPIFKFPWNAGEYCEAELIINNYGNYPVKVTESGAGFIVRFNTPSENEISKTKEMAHKMNTFLIKGTPLKTTIKRIFTNEEVRMIASGAFKVNTIGYFNYENQITKEKKQYQFIIKSDLAKKDNEIVFTKIIAQ